MQYTNAERWLTLRRLAPFVLVPLITTILAFTSPLHHPPLLRFTFFRSEGLLAMRVFHLWRLVLGADDLFNNPAGNWGIPHMD